MTAQSLQMLFGDLVNEAEMESFIMPVCVCVQRRLQQNKIQRTSVKECYT